MGFCSPQAIPPLGGRVVVVEVLTDVLVDWVVEVDCDVEVLEVDVLILVEVEIDVDVDIEVEVEVELVLVLTLVEVDWLVLVECEVLVELVEIEVEVDEVEIEVEELVEVVVAPDAGLTTTVAAAQKRLLLGVNVPGSSTEAASCLVAVARLTLDPPLDVPLLCRLE